jgi:preprotein translocase subunit SecA
MYDVCEFIVNQFHGTADYNEFILETIRLLSVEAPFSENDYMKLSSTELIEKLHQEVWNNYKHKSIALAKQSFPVVKDVYEKQSGVYENIVVPISDGLRIYQIITNLKKAYETKCAELVKSYEKAAILMTIDDAWREHLREMDDLKQSVQNAAYEQKDPLLIYKFESFELFRTMVEDINKHVVSMLIKGNIPVTDPASVQRAQSSRKTDMSKFAMNKSEAPSSLGGNASNQEKEQQRVQPVRIEKKIGRNDPCPCGSGKKYKNCHGAGVGANL